MYLLLLLVNISTAQTENGFSNDKKNALYNYKTQSKVSNNSIINEYCNEINADSIQAIIQSLQDFGTRFMLAPNRKAVADWIKNKFISIGYQNTIIDSFTVTKNWLNTDTTVWQYNVIATLQGMVNPQNIYITGGHYDCYTNFDPMIVAPGADDDASGVAAVIEIARVLKQNGYAPNTTIKFVAFGAEELMISPGGSGSLHYATELSANNENVICYINNDMIAYEPDSANWKIILSNYDNSEPITLLAKQVCQQFTSLTTVDENNNEWADSHSFWEVNIPTIFLLEYNFNPFYHSANDLLTNLNLAYCREISKVTLGILIKGNETPVAPKNLKIVNHGDGHSLELSWSPNNETDLAGYKLYVGLDTGNYYEVITTTDTIYTLDNLLQDTLYHIAISSFNNSNESVLIEKTKSTTTIPLNNGILIVDDSYGGLLNPPDSSIDNFYHQLLSDYTYTDYDANATGTIDLSVMGNYSTIVWHVEKMNTGSVFFSHKTELTDYLESGGNLFINMEKFSFGIEHNNIYPKTFGEGDFIHDYLKIDSVNKLINARFFGGVPYTSEYTPIFIDTLKTPAIYMHHINNVDALYPNPEGTAIYKYYSQYDSTSLQGGMDGMPVGVKYTGNGYHVVSLSFPLYYMNYSEAKNLVDKVLHNEFGEPTGILEKETKNPQSAILFQNSPNPCNANTTIKYFLPEKTNVTLEAYNIYGQNITTLVNETQAKGFYTITWNTGNLMSGTYFYCLKSLGNYSTRKLIIIK